MPYYGLKSLWVSLTHLNPLATPPDARRKGQGRPVGLRAAATLYQKRFCNDMPFRSGNVIQLAAAGLVTGGLALLFETRAVVWSGEFVFALAWLILVLSLGAFMLLYLLIQRGAAARVASLFYLVPPSTALVAWLLFGESFGPLALAGMALTVVGVALANRTG